MNQMGGVRDGSGQREPLVSFQLRIELGPSASGLQVEAGKVEGHELRIEFRKQGLDALVEFGGIECFGQFAVHCAFAVVRDAHAVAESGEHFLLASHEVGLEKVFADSVAGLDHQQAVNPCVLILERFFLDEDRAQFPMGGE